MYVVPDSDAVRDVALSLGMHLSDRDSVLYQERIAACLKTLHNFMQTPMDESRPPISFTHREAGYRPSRQEDPMNAWLWRCSIRGSSDGILSGKTVSFKDNVAVAGIPLTFGSLALADYIADFDATVVSSALEAGGTVVGKNSMDGFSGLSGLGGASGDFGRTKNPYGDDYLSGGSSSGSAVAVASGDVDISFGSDYAGSIRIPCAWTGAVGLKPTFGLISQFGVGFGSEPSCDHLGPIACSVEDVATALDAVAGYDGGLDPRQDRKVPNTVDASGTLADGVAGLRIGLLDEGFSRAEPEVADRVRAAADILAGEGAILSKVSVPEHMSWGAAQAALTFEGMRAIFDTGLFGAFSKTYYPASLIGAVNRVWRAQTDSLDPFWKFAYLVAEFSRRAYHGRVYAKAHNVRQSFVRAYDASLSEVDVLLMPTCVTKAPRTVSSGDEGDAISRSLQDNAVASAARNTSPFSYTGHPALAVPCGTSEGLPVSMQLVGRSFEDHVLLRAGYTYERAISPGRGAGSAA